MIDKIRKAYRIKTKLDTRYDDFSIYSATTAGKAKTTVVFAMKDVCSKASYSWITSCRRAPEYDILAERYGGCIAWKQNGENWKQDATPSHWWDNAL